MTRDQKIKFSRIMKIANRLYMAEKQKANPYLPPEACEIRSDQLKSVVQALIIEMDGAK